MRRRVIARLATHRHFRELAFACLAFLVCAGFSAHAALRAIADHPAVEAPPVPQHEAAAADPGAALAPGTTGTTALPDLPVPTDADPGDGSVIPARPFSMAAASPVDRARALTCLADAVYYEAASESDDGQRAVAQVVLNRVRHPAFPGTVCGVVFQGSARETGCQFSFACDGAMARAPAPAAWNKALRIAGAALGGYVFAPVGLATHYHTYKVRPAWSRELVMTDAIGAHFFHRWAGWWGTPAAFSRTYAGGEPRPGPHGRSVDPAAEPMPTTIAAGQTPAPAAVSFSARPAVVAMVRPAYAESGTPRADALPESGVLDKWKNSGKPIE